MRMYQHAKTLLIECKLRMWDDTSFQATNRFQLLKIGVVFHVTYTFAWY